VVEGVYSGTQTGPLATPGGNIAPTGRAFSFPFLEVYVVQDGRFTEHRGYWDIVTFMTQLGLMPEPASA
jgi:ketosteroid isomerase-like protein